jgi:dTDP-4-amino-4,6-dideoxygalactose transaminase
MSSQLDKARAPDLALLGGHPLFENPLHVGRPNIGDRAKFMARVGDIFDRRWLTNDGPLVQQLEREISGFLGVDHCVAVCNATIGLELAARALGLSGEVLLPSFTFVATAHALRWLGLDPVFCDIDPRTHTLDPERVQAKITPRTSGILGVHVWGRACPVEELSDLASKHNLALLFDAAHAFGCTHGGRMLGSFGDLEVFSFHATKFFNSFEGGAITTKNAELADRLRQMRNFGFADTDRVVSLGTNAKMSEISAAMALSSLEAIDEFIDVNRRNYLQYVQGLADLPGVTIVRYSEQERGNFQYVVLEIDPDRAGLDRDLLVKLLRAEGVLARRYFFPGCHQMEPYRSEQPDAAQALPETERLTMRVLQLPTGTAVSERQVRLVCDLIRFALNFAPQIRQVVGAGTP